MGCTPCQGEIQRRKRTMYVFDGLGSVMGFGVFHDLSEKGDYRRPQTILISNKQMLKIFLGMLEKKEQGTNNLVGEN